MRTVGNFDLKQVMELAGQNLLDSLCPTRNYLPYWCLSVDDDYRAEFNFGWPGHNIGRWWDAMLRLEQATGFAIPPRIEAAMLENVMSFFDNPDNLCFAPLDSNIENVEPLFELHSLREGLLSLHALAKYRQNKWAVEKGHKMIETVLCIANEDGSWDCSKIDYYHRTDNRIERHMDLTGSSGRIIEALVYFYETTGDSLALTLADRFARYHLANSTCTDGRLNTTSRPDHAHSYLNTLRGLLLFGIKTGQHQYVDAIVATYRGAVQKIVKKTGFASHDLLADVDAETGSPGDAAQLALWLAMHGYSEFFDDAERLVRARLVPCQITDTPALYPRSDDGKDEHFNLEKRIIGGIGGVRLSAHHGKNCVTDVTSAALHTLTNIYNHIAVHTDAGLTVNFHMGYEDKHIHIVSEREGVGHVTIIPKIRKNLFIRIPQWVSHESVEFVINDQVFTPVMLGDFALVPREMLPATVLHTYALPHKIEQEETGGVPYEVAWRGDDIVGISPNNKFYPLYPSLNNN